MKRGLIIGGGVVAVAVIALVVFVFSSLDSLIKAGVETYGTEITQAKVTLETVELDITSGKGTLAGLVVGNPKGFATPSAFKLGRISITLDTATITSDPVVIKEIVITKPDITYELGPGGSNIDAIQNNVKAYMARFGGGKTAEKDAKDSEGPKLIIRNLYIRGGTVNVSAVILKGKKMTVPLPDIHLTDIGGKDKGATPGEVAEKILTAISQGASGAVAGIGIGKTLESLEKILSGATQGLGGDLGGITKDIGGSLESGASEVGKTLKGLFGN